MSTSTQASILTQGKQATLRIWRDEEPNQDSAEEARPYETLGYIISGEMELTLDGQTVSLKAGDAYNVPMNTPHRYVITQRLTAVEAIVPSQSG